MSSYNIAFFIIALVGSLMAFISLCSYLLDKIDLKESLATEPLEINEGPKATKEEIWSLGNKLAQQGWIVQFTPEKDAFMASYGRKKNDYQNY